MKDVLRIPKVLKIPEVEYTTLKYYVNDEFVGDVTLEQACQIRVNAVRHIVDKHDTSIIDSFYFIGHENLYGERPGPEIKITMDEYGHLSDIPYELDHVRRAMYELIQLGKNIRTMSNN